MITWEQLLHFSSLSGEEPAKQQKPDRIFEQYSTPWAGETLDNPACLYLVQDTNTDKLHIREDISAIVVSTSDTPGEFPAFSNYLILPLEKICLLSKELESSFQRQEDFRNETKKLLRFMVENKGLNAMTKELSAWLHRPVALLDLSLRFISRATTKDLESMLEPEDRGILGVKEERLNSLIKAGVLEKAQQTPLPFYAEVEHFLVYLIPVNLQGIRAGYLGIPGSKRSSLGPLPDEYVHELSALSEIFSAELAKLDRGIQGRRQDLASIFSYLLEQQPPLSVQIVARLSAFGYQLFSDFYLIYVPYRSQNQPTVSVIAEKLKALFPNCFTLIRDTDILLLMSRPSGRKLTEKEKTAWEKQLKSLRLRCGISECFHDFTALRDIYFKEAQLAYQAGFGSMPEKNLYLFEDLKTNILFTDMQNSNLLPYLCFQPLMKLIAYDRNKGGALVETLKTYLRFPKQPQEVCGQLFIHKNTLYKRLDKIGQIMECDYNDPEVIMKIQLTFHILQYLEKSFPGR